MSRVMVTRTVEAPVHVVWEIFTDLSGRGAWLSDVDSVELLTPGSFGPGTRWRETRGAVTEELVVAATEPGRSCTITLAGAEASHRLTYTFTPIEIGAQRGATTVSAIYEGRPHGLTSRFLAFFLGGLEARTVEGALRVDLEALAAAGRAGGLSASPGRAWRGTPAA
ncbi:MAG: SRPBCC family protein [Micromonosporaceae bacterium]